MSSTVAVKAFAEGVTQQIKEHLPENVRLRSSRKIMVRSRQELFLTYREESWLR